MPWSSLSSSPSRVPRSFQLLVYCCAVAATIGLCQPQSSGLHAAVDELSFRTDLSHHPSPFPHTWEECVGSGHAALALRSDWQQQLLTVHKELGFRRVRFHGLLDDDMSVVLENGSYSFSKIDTVYDYITSIGMSPSVELSFMPQHLASSNRTYLHYKANTTPPRSYEEWAKESSHTPHRRLGQALAPEIPCVSQWLIEVWNEPNLYNIVYGGFWDGTQAEYFKLYNYTALALKRVSDEFKVGGPVTAGGGWLKEFASYCQENRIPLDFISTHGYPSSKLGLVEAIEAAKSQIAGRYPLVFSEFNSGLYLLEDNDDTSFAAAFVAQVVPQVVSDVAVLCYWTFSDIFEELFFNTVPFHDGYGLLTVNGIPKPAYRAFQLLHRLGNYSIAAEWDTGRGNTSEVTAFVVMEMTNNVVQVLLSNFVPLFHLLRDFNVTCVLNSVPPHSVVTSVTMYRISTTEANPRAAWETMGRPSTLTSKQREELMAASEVKPVQLPFVHNQKETSLSFTAYLPCRSVALIEVEFQEMANF